MWDSAASFYRQALGEFPNQPQALTSLGLALFELQLYDEALECYKRAAKASQDDPLPMEKVAQLYERLGNLAQATQASLLAAELYLKKKDANKAIENWERVTRLAPENLKAHSRLALVYERMGEKDKAVTAYLAVASILQSSGDMERSVSAATRALQADPESSKAAKAIKTLNDFKPLPMPERPRGGTAPLRMAQVRQLEAPSEEIDAEFGMDPVAQARQKALTDLAGMLFEGSDEERDEKQARRGLQAIVAGSGMLRKPTDHTRIILHLSQVVDLQTKGQLEEAVSELERAIDFGLEHPAANFDLGFLYSQVGRIESAIRQLQHSVRHVDYSLGAHLLLADLYGQKGQIKEASLGYLEALRLADGQMVLQEQVYELRQLYEPVFEGLRQQEDLEVHKQLCDNVKALLMRPDWRAQLERAREQLPKRGVDAPPVPLAEILTEARSSKVIDAISEIYELAAQNKLRSAMEESFYAIDHAPTYLPLHKYMGELLVKQGELGAAVNKFQIVARSYTVRGELLQSINLYRRITELSPMDINSRNRLIEQLLLAGKVDEGVKEYINLAEMYYNLADLVMARKTYREALRMTQQSQVDRSLRVDVLYRMADIDLQSLDWRQALRIFEQVRTLQPGEETARLQLVDLNFRLGREDQAISEMDNYLSFLSDNNKTDKAVEFLETLIGDYPDRAPVRRRLADLFLYLGQDEEAIKHLDALGDLLVKAGERALAIQTIKEILDLDPPNKVDYRFLLQQIRSQDL